jgi:tetratricopeptide (TPR) repeat protein
MIGATRSSGGPRERIGVVVGRIAAATLVTIVAASCAGSRDGAETTPATAAGATPPAAKLFPDLGRFHRAATTSSPEAQKYFDQGLLFCYGFNHEEAIRSFQKAAELDPGFAMAWWGAALAAGPNINNPAMDEAASRAAADAVARAQKLASNATPVERDLIDALSKRYVWPPPKERRQLDEAYAAAMREVWARHRDDADVGALFAESMMDLRPWDLFTPDGKAQPGTDEILSTLVVVLALVPDHPGGLHYTVHGWEMSTTPEKALPAADKLRDRVPGAGHLVHMPSHIDMRVGHYPEAILANERAIEQDLRYCDYAGRMNFYSIYRAHNYHMLAWAASFDGQSAKALKAARDLVHEMPQELVAAYPDFVEAYLTVPYHVLIRFGRWDEILAEPEPAKELKSTRTFWHYARAMACSSLGRLDDAAKERAEFDRAAAEVPASAVLSLTPVSALCEVARALMDGELAYRRRDYDRAFELLRTAVARDVALRYDEPWGWMQPPAHALGALLLEQGRIDEAEAVYHADLNRRANDGWSLHGLAECARRRGDAAAAARAQQLFDEAWKRADVKLRASCYCATGQ